MHRVPLWAFHQVHHSAETMTPFTIFRTHPVEGVIFIADIDRSGCGYLFLFFFGSKVDLVTVFGASVGVVIFHSLGQTCVIHTLRLDTQKLLNVFSSTGTASNSSFNRKTAFWQNLVWRLRYDLMPTFAFSENAQHKFGLKTEFGSKQSIMHLYVKLSKWLSRLCKDQKN